MTRPDPRLPAVRHTSIDRATLLDRLGEVDQPPPELHSWLSRAAVADRLPELVKLDQESCYDLCVDVVRHLTPRAAGQR